MVGHQRARRRTSRDGGAGQVVGGDAIADVPDHGHAGAAAGDSSVERGLERVGVHQVRAQLAKAPSQRQDVLCERRQRERRRGLSPSPGPATHSPHAGRARAPPRPPRPSEADATSGPCSPSSTCASTPRWARTAPMRRTSASSPPDSCAQWSTYTTRRRTRSPRARAGRDARRECRRAGRPRRNGLATVGRGPGRPSRTAALTAARNASGSAQTTGSSEVAEPGDRGGHGRPADRDALVRLDRVEALGERGRPRAGRRAHRRAAGSPAPRRTAADPAGGRSVARRQGAPARGRQRIGSDERDGQVGLRARRAARPASTSRRSSCSEPT